MKYYYRRLGGALGVRIQAPPRGVADAIIVIYNHRIVMKCDVVPDFDKDHSDAIQPVDGRNADTSTASSFFKTRIVLFLRSKPVLTLFVSVMLLIGVGIYTFHVLQPQNIKISTHNTPSPMVSGSDAQKPHKEGQWILRKTTAAGSDTVFSLPDRGEHQIAQWNDYLFWGSGDYTDNVQVNTYNFKTGQTDTIYDQKTQNDLQSGRNNRYVSDMQIINDTLFFSVGGYMTSGATYWKALPPIGEPQKLIDGANGRIQHWNNRYWILHGEGDGCAGGTNYALLDLTSKYVVQIASSVSGCTEGEEYIAIDKRERMILAFHTAGSSDVSGPTNGTYLYVLAVPLSNPQNKEDVIAKQDMPSGITSVLYLSDTDQLYLKGKENYLYDFASQSLSQISTIPVVPTPTPHASEKTFKEKVNELKLPSGFTLLLE